MCGCFGNMYTVLWLRVFLPWLRFFLPWLRFFLPWLRFFLPWLRFFSAFFPSCKANSRVKLAKTGHGPHSSTLVVICVVRLLFVLFYVLFVWKCVLPPGDNPNAVNKYIYMCVCVCARVCVRAYVCGPIWRLNPWGYFFFFFQKVALTHHDDLPSHYSFVCNHQTDEQKDRKISCNVTFWRVRIPISTVENATVPYLRTFERQHLFVPLIPLASYKIFRTAPSIALIDVISRHCLLGEAFPLYIMLSTWPLHDDDWCQPKHVVVLNKGPLY